jgi:methionine aminotransferase
MKLPLKHSVQGSTIFTVMSALAQQHSAINLSQGFPDFEVDSKMGQLLNEAVTTGFNQYAPMAGLPQLRQAISSNFRKRYAVVIHPDTEITITPGATYGIYTAFTAILQPGDEVIVLEPAYDSYIPNIETNGGVVITVPLSSPSFKVDWNRVKDAITPKTKAIIVNTPHNPTGAIWDKQDWNQLAALVRNTDIIVISDEVYEQLVFDGKEHYSILQHQELRQRSFAIYSFGKVFNNTGWKIGFCVAPPEFTQAFRHIHQFLCFSVNTPAQYALATYLSQPKLPDVTRLMQQKRDYFLELLKATPFKIHGPASGSYFQTVSYERISDMPDMEFAEYLTKEYGVATIPISAFYRDRKDDKLIRFCFAKKEETLSKAMERLSKLQPAPISSHNPVLL